MHCICTIVIVYALMGLADAWHSRTIRRRMCGSHMNQCHYLFIGTEFPEKLDWLATLLWRNYKLHYQCE